MRPVGVGLAGLQSRWHVTQGSYELGCSEGTVLDHPLAGDEEFGAGGVQQVFTCTDGKRSGSFVIAGWKGDPRLRLGEELELPRRDQWLRRSQRQGLSSVRVILHPRTVGIETIRGTARFWADPTHARNSHLAAEPAERFIEEVRGDDPELANSLRIEEPENWRARQTSRGMESSGR
jgi:hypothetical protein